MNDKLLALLDKTLSERIEKAYDAHNATSDEKTKTYYTGEERGLIMARGIIRETRESLQITEEDVLRQIEKELLG